MALCFNWKMKALLAEAELIDILERNLPFLEIIRGNPQHAFRECVPFTIEAIKLLRQHEVDTLAVVSSSVEHFPMKHMTALVKTKEGESLLDVSIQQFITHFPEMNKACTGRDSVVYLGSRETLRAMYNEALQNTEAMLDTIIPGGTECYYNQFDLSSRESARRYMSDVMPHLLESDKPVLVHALNPRQHFEIAWGEASIPVPMLPGINPANIEPGKWDIAQPTRGRGPVT